MAEEKGDAEALALAEAEAAEKAKAATEEAAENTDSSEELSESFLKLLEEEDADEKKPDEHQDKKQVRHPVEELMESNPLVAAFNNWAFENPTGDFEDFLQQIEYKTGAVNIEEVIAERTKATGKRLGWNKSKIEEAVAVKLEEYNELEGIKKEIFEADILETVKPKSTKYLEYVDTVKKQQKARQEESKVIEAINTKAIEEINKKVSDIAGKKFMEFYPIPAEDKEAIINNAIRISEGFAIVEKGKLKGYDVAGLVQATIMSRYGKKIIKAVALKKTTEGQLKAKKEQVRPSAGESGATKFAGGKSKTEVLTEIGKSRIW